MGRKTKRYLPKWPVVVLATIMILMIILPIACIDGPGKTANFKECKVWPQFRCPDDEVRASWSTSPNTSIKITIGGNTVSKPGHGDLVMSAADFNAYGDVVDIKFKIDIPGGEQRTIRVETIRGFEEYARDGLAVTGSTTPYRYKVDLPAQTWSDDIHVYALTLVKPKSYRCGGSSQETSFKWQYDKTMAISGYLLKENDFQKTFDNPQPKAAGTWYFTIQNPSDDRSCPGWKEIDKIPRVTFRVACK